MQVRLRENASRHDLVDCANKTGQLASFAPFLPSMDNIFINAIQAAGGQASE